MFSSDLMTWGFYALIAFVPICVWFFCFRKHLPQKKSYLVLTFLAGILSVLPIKLYEKYWNSAVLELEHVNLFKHFSSLLDLQTAESLVTYAAAMVVVICGLFLFSALMMFVLEVGSGDNTLKVFRKKCGKIFESPRFFIVIGIFCGVMAFMSSLSIQEKVWFFMLVGVLEEFIKHLVLRFADEDRISSVAEAVQYSIVVALGFAFMENILYFQSMGSLALFSSGEVAVLVALRSIISVSAHVAFSAVLGYFYGVAKFSSKIYQEEAAQQKHPIIERLHQLIHLKGSVLFHEQKMMEGVLLAMLLHGVFNSLLEFGYIGFVFPYMFILMLIVMHVLHRQERLALQGAFLVRNQSRSFKSTIQT